MRINKMQLQKGQKLKIEDGSISNVISLTINYQASFNLDMTCFGLNENEKLYHDDYMIFYNQLNTPKKEVDLQLNNNQAIFNINLNHLPNDLTKLVFTATIDQENTLNQITQISCEIQGNNFVLTSQDFQQEKAVMLMEIYKKDNVWRIGANGQGFNGGLEALLNHFGGAVSNEPTNTQVEQTNTINPVKEEKPKLSLEKKFENKAPQLVSLAKKAAISLEKNKLTNVKAKVAFIFDASGSMYSQYAHNKVQEALNRVFPLGVHFDDDEQLETWAFALKSMKLSNVEFSNYKDYVEKEDGGWNKWMNKLNAAHNNEPEVIKDVIKHFTKQEYKPNTVEVEKTGFLGFGKKKELVAVKNEFAKQIDSKTPILVLFMSDGGIDRNSEIEQLMRWSSSLPIFWQFIGIGGSSYGALQNLDNLSGRYIDNANFFSINDLASISESELYDRMMEEFPKWLEEAYKKGLIDNYKI